MAADSSVASVTMVAVVDRLGEVLAGRTASQHPGVALTDVSAAER